MNTEAVRLLRGEQVLEIAHARGMDDLGEQWIETLVRSKRLAYTRVGKFRRFREDAVVKMFDGLTRQAA